jgi:tetratricopeptide (TPR) repeat protein
VFAGGCGLDALAAVAVTGPRLAGTDPLELAAELLDVSLITVADGPDGEPRVSLLETVQDYALERLAQAGELDEAQQRHALYYASFAERAQQQLYGPDHLAALDRLEADHDNLAAALSWSLGTAAADPATGAQRAAIGVRLVVALAAFWYQQGYVAEGRHWLQQAMQLITDDAGAPFARVAGALAALLAQQGEPAAALPLQKRSLAMWRQLGGRYEQAFELNGIGITSRRLGDFQAARSALQESVAISRELGTAGFPLTAALTNLGLTEHEAGHAGRAVQHLQEALELAERRGDMYAAAHVRLSLAKTSLRDGHANEEQEQLAATFGYATHSGNAEVLATTLELSACIAASRGANLRAARLAGAAEAIREHAGIPRLAEDADLLEDFLAPARASTAPQSWDSELATSRALSQQDAAALLPGLPAPESQ